MRYMKVIKMIYDEHSSFDSSLANHFKEFQIKFNMHSLILKC
jgi:hypothetical protein